MKVKITCNQHKKFYFIKGKMTVTIDFELDSEHDRTKARGFNAGSVDLKLQGTSASFYFPFSFKLPHPDLVALACIKIISPYVGRQLELERGVSPEFAEFIQKRYGFSLFPIDHSLKKRKPPVSPQWGVSFSGGADSVAASLIMPKTIPLIFSMRTQHTSLPEIEQWYNVDGNLQSLNAMPDSYNKIVVKTDFEYLSTHISGNWCHYPDNYSFTIPAILLADHLNLKGIITGDIWAAFTADESVLKVAGDFKSHENGVYEQVGLMLDYPLSGVGEFGSALINRNFGMQDKTTTCAYGEYQNPCGKCLKCFRKTLIACAISGELPTRAQLEKFELSEDIRRYLVSTERSSYAWFPTYKYVYQRLGKFDSPLIDAFFERISGVIPDANFSLKYHPRAYQNRENILPEVTTYIKQNFEVMTEDEVNYFDNFETVSVFQKDQNSDS